MSSNTMINWRPNNVIRQLPWSLDSKAALGILLILATFSLVGWLYLTQASAVTATSYRIDELRLELDQLKNQNAVLSLEIAQFQALSHVEKRALELGFRPTTNIRYLSVSSYPNQLSADSMAYDPVRLNSRPLDSASLQAGEAIWWDALIDGLTAWLVGE